MSYSKQDLQKMGQAAARVYRERGVDMNTSIAKLSKEKGLNRHQLNRVVEFANLDCFNSERQRRVAESKEASSGKKGDLYIVFDLADPKKAMAKTSELFEEKVASEEPPPVQVPREYSREVPRSLRLSTSFPLPQVKTASRQAAQEEEDAAWDTGPKVDPLVHKIAKAEEAGKRVKEKQLKAEISRLEAEDKIASTMRTMILDNGLKLDDVLYAVNVHQAHKTSEERHREIISGLGRVITKLAQTGVIRLASEVNPEEFIAKKFDMGAMGPMRIVNGNHPLFGEIDIFLRSADQERRYGAALQIYNDKIHYAKRVLRGELPRTDTSNTVRADTDKTAGVLYDSVKLVGQAGLDSGKAIGSSLSESANNFLKRIQERSTFQRDLQHPLLSDRSPEEVAPYHKLLSKVMGDQFLDMPEDIRAKLLLQLYHVGGAPNEQGGIDLNTLTSLQQIGGSNPRYHKDEVRKQHGPLKRLLKVF